MNKHHQQVPANNVTKLIASTFRAGEYWFFLMTICAALAAMPLVYWSTLFAPSATPRTALIGCVAPVLLALYLVFQYLSGRLLIVRRPAIVLSLVGFIILNLISLAWTPDPLEAKLWITNVLAFSCWFALVSLFASQAGKAEWLLGASTVGGCAAALIGVLQRFNVEVPPYAQTLAPGSTFLYANVAAQYFSILVPLALVMTLRAKRRLPIVGWGLSFLIMLAYVVFTKCRGAWLGVGIAVIATGILLLARGELRRDLWQRFSAFKAIAAAVLLAVVVTGAILSPPGNPSERRASWSEMLKSFAEPWKMVAADQEQAVVTSSLMRWRMLGCATRAFRDHWVLGVGSAGFRAGIAPYLDQPTSDICYTPQIQIVTLHCDLFQVALENGVVGAVLMLIIVVSIVRSGWRVITHPVDGESRWIGLACLAGLAAVAIESLVDFPFQMPTPAFMAVTLAGILVGLDRRPSETLANNGSKWKFSAMALLPVVCLVAVACIIVNIRFLAAMSHTYNAYVAKRQGQGARAVYEIDQAMAWSNWHYSVRREYGVIHSRFNPNREQALLACQRALADDPYYINNLVNIAGVEMELGRLADARGHLEHALQINDKLHLAHYALGLVNLAEGKPDAAKASFQACLQLDPGFKPALERLTSTSRAEGR